MAELRDWDENYVQRRVRRILEDYAPVIGQEARSQLIDKKWEWPNSTLRFRSFYQGGDTVRTQYGTGVRIPAGNRDIVDTGFLLDSQTEPQITDRSLTIAWTAPYAEQVLRGSYPAPYFHPVLNKTLKAPGDKPARNWIVAALREQPFQPFFVTRWRELAGA